MSRVTNVMVAVGVDNWSCDNLPQGILEINAVLEEEARGQILICIDNYVGGSKDFEISVWAAAFNYVPVDAIVRAAVNAHWENPQQVQLMICDQEDYIFTVKTVEEWSRLHSYTCSKCGRSIIAEILYTYEDRNGKWYYFCSEECFLGYLDDLIMRVE